MPFTLAHPAAVLPLIRRPFVASALVAGAVAPDLLYVDPIYRFATQEIDGNFTLTLTHSFTSALWVDPLLALVGLAVFNLVVKRPLLALAPPPVAARLPSPRSPLRLPPFGVLLWTVVSAIVGAFTHVLWDWFAHDDDYFVRQYVSTVAGCLILAVWLYRWYRRTEPQPVTPGDLVASWVRYVVLTATVLLAVAGAVVQSGRADGDFAVRLLLTGLLSGGLAALGWYVVLWHAARLRRGVAAL